MRTPKSVFLPWARRTSVGRRNLLTTASNGSATVLHAISDRLADNFSILPGHNGHGLAIPGTWKDDGLGVGEITAKSLAMFE